MSKNSCNKTVCDKQLQLSASSEVSAALYMSYEMCFPTFRQNEVPSSEKVKVLQIFLDSVTLEEDETTSLRNVENQQPSQTAPHSALH